MLQVSERLLVVTAVGKHRVRKIIAVRFRHESFEKVHSSPSVSLSTRASVINPAGPHQNSFGLTLLQRGYLIGRGESVELGNVASHVYQEFDGHWDLDRLESALRMMVARHGILGTWFTDDGRQVTEPAVDVRIEQLDLRALPPDEQQGRLAELREERSHRMLPIDRAP